MLFYGKCNLLTGFTATSSGSFNYKGVLLSPDHGNDLQTTGDTSNLSHCLNSNVFPFDWWMVDLVNVSKPINSIFMSARESCCPER